MDYALVNFHVYSGAALLVEAANMGDPEAQYELGCRLRIEVFTLHVPFVPFHSASLMQSQLFVRQLIVSFFIRFAWNFSSPQLMVYLCCL